MTHWPGMMAAMQFARAALREPPRHSWIERPGDRGPLLWECVLPATLCPPLNRFGEMPSWKRTEIKAEAITLMLKQHGHARRRRPLPGRPAISCVRFTSMEADPDTGWSKVPVDRLQVKNKGLGFIANDRGRDIDLRCWWESGRRGAGFVYVAVYTGATA